LYPGFLELRNWRGNVNKQLAAQWNSGSTRESGNSECGGFNTAFCLPTPYRAVLTTLTQPYGLLIRLRLLPDSALTV